MKNLQPNAIIFILMFVSLFACNQNADEQNDLVISKYSYDTVDLTNNFYDNAETIDLPVLPISIEGEIKNPIIVDFSDLPLRSVIVKETVLVEDRDKFVGAYRYDGYSLYDILNNIIGVFT